MSRRIAGWTTVMLAALCPALCLAQQPYYDPQMPAPISSAGYAAPYAGDYGSMNGGYPGGYCPPGQQGWTRYTQMPDDCGWAYGDTELDKMLTNIFRHAFFRLEYLNWAISDPGPQVLGAPALSQENNNNIADPRQIFDQFNSSGTIVGNVIQPTLDNVHLYNNNGIRGTWGFNFEPFTLEGSVFALQAAHTNVLTTNLPIQRQADFFDITTPLPLFIGNNTLINGVIVPATGTTYDTYYGSQLRTNVWGSDLKVVIAPYDLGSPLQIHPLVGLKFLNFNESLNQFGVGHTDAGDSTSNQFQVGIHSQTRNYLYGPQIGFRAELESHFLTIGVEPKIMFGANSYQARLVTQGALTSATDGTTTTDGQVINTNQTTFGTVADLQTYARGRISEHLSVYVAFNLMWAGGVTRPYQNVVYNLSTTSSSSNEASAFQQDVHFTDLMLYGVSVGGQVDW